MVEELTEKEVAYLSELRKHENRWVAVLKSEGVNVLVGSGKDAVEAKNEAALKGFTDVVLFWVRPFNGRYVSAL
jgi:predicted RNA-binding protein with PUA domain